MNFLADFFAGRRAPDTEPNESKLEREPVGFFARFTPEQRRDIKAYRGDDRVGDPAEVVAIAAAVRETAK